ncbi:MAG: hypothetical protein RXQ75_09350 [Acidianus hospitalis]
MDIETPIIIRYTWKYYEKYLSDEDISTTINKGKLVVLLSSNGEGKNAR